MNKSIGLGTSVILVLLVALVGLAIFLWYRQQPKSYGETVVSPEVIEITPSRQSAPGGGGLALTTRQVLIDKIHHGFQYDSPSDPAERGDPKIDFSRLATTYYHRDGPLGRVLERFNWFGDPPNVFRGDARLPASLCGSATTGLGLCGLPMGCLAGAWSEPPIAMVFPGPGILASYARPFQAVDFYERNSRVIDIATKSFTFVKDARDRGANLRIFPGMERKTIESAGPRGFYHVLVIDTSRGDPARPSTELLTVEAFQLFADTLAPDGIICFHTSSRNFDLDRVVAGAAGQSGSVARQGLDTAGGRQPIERFASDWVMVGRREHDLRHIVPGAAGAGGITWTTLGPANSVVWRDADLPQLRNIHR